MAGQGDQAKLDPNRTAAEFPICTACGSERVVRDAWASWDTEAQDWQLDAVFDYSFCLACEQDDPHGEHDFGALTVQGEKLFFKIDYYDLSMSAHSPDAADASITKRVLTIMLASEY